MSGKGKTVQMAKRLGVAWGWRLTENGPKGFYWGNGNIIKWTIPIVAQPHKFSKNLCIKMIH